MGTLATPEFVLYVREVVTPKTSFFLGSDTTMVTLSCTAYGDAVSEVVWSSHFGTNITGMTARLLTSNYTHYAELDYQHVSSVDKVTCKFIYTADNAEITGENITLQYIDGKYKFSTH